MGRERGIFYQPHTRRDILKKGVSIAASLPFFQIPEGFSDPHIERERQRIVADVFGIHILGGGDFKDLTVFDLNTLFIHNVMAIEPDKELFEKLYHPENGPLIDRETGKHGLLVARMMPEDNRDDKKTGELRMKIERTFKRAEPYAKHLYIEPFNETNLDRPKLPEPMLAVPPDVHAEEFVDIALFIKERGGTPLITAVAPHAPGSEEYFRRMLQGIKNDPRFPQLLEQTGDEVPLAIAFHAYYQDKNDNVISYLQKQNIIAEEMLGVKLQAFATEVGISVDAIGSLSEKEESDIVFSFLSSQIPKDLSNFQAVFWWTLAANAQRRQPLPFRLGGEDWDDQSLRISRFGTQRVTPTYIAIQSFMANHMMKFANINAPAKNVG